MNCEICGTYDIDFRAHSGEVDSRIQGDIHLLSGITRRAYESQTGPFLVTTNMIGDPVAFEREIASTAPRGIAEKEEALLKHVAKKSQHPGARVSFSKSKGYTLGFCSKPEELDFYVRHLIQSRLVTNQEHESSDNVDLELTPAGWDRLRAIQSANLESDQAFVAMSFNKSMDTAFVDGMKKLEADTGFRMFRIDRSEYNEKICDQILVEVRKSRFVISEVTEHRQGVYFVKLAMQWVLGFQSFGFAARMILRRPILTLDSTITSFGNPLMNSEIGCKRAF